MSDETGYAPFADATTPRTEFSNVESVALDPLREIAAELAAEYSRIQERAREAEQRSATAMETVQDVEERLGALAALQELSRHIDERFDALHALAEEVTVTNQSLNAQKEMIEQAEVKLGRLEEVAAETAAQLERREQLRDELGRELVRLETEVQVLTGSVQRQIEAAKTESGVWEDLRVQLGDSERAVKQSVAEGAALKGVLEDIGHRLGPLAALHDLSRHTDERLEALQTLAEEVTVKGETLNDQKQMIERAVVEAARVADLVDALDTRLATLKDGDRLLEMAEARFARLEELAAETTAQFQRRDRLRDELRLELVRQEMEVQILTESGQRLQDLGRHTDEQFKALNALADEVTVKGHTLTSQKEMIERAVVEAGRVTGLVAAMETRIAKLKDEDRLLEQTEARLERLEQVAAETTAQLERREQLRDDLARELVRLEMDVQLLTESSPRQAGTAVDPKQPSEAVDPRPFIRPALRPDPSPSIGSVNVPVEPPAPGGERDEPSASPELPLADLVTRLRTPKASDVGNVLLQPDGVRLRLIKQSGAGVGLALLVLVGVIVMRPAGKTTQIAPHLLPAETLPSLSISVPVLPGTNVIPDEPGTPATATKPSAIATRPQTIPTRPPATAARPPAVDTQQARAAVPSAEYFGTLAFESTPPGAAVFLDRQQVGQTPLEVPHVRAGSHAVRIEREGYQRWTAAVNVPASQVTRVTVRLDAEVVR